MDQGGIPAHWSSLMSSCSLYQGAPHSSSWEFPCPQDLLQDSQLLSALSKHLGHNLSFTGSPPWSPRLFRSIPELWKSLDAPGAHFQLPQSVRSSCDLSGTQEVCTSRTVGVAWSVQGQRFITKSCRMYWKPCSQDTNHRASRGLGLQTKTSFSFTYINHFVATKSKTKLDSARSHWPQSRTAVNTCLP